MSKPITDPIERHNTKAARRQSRGAPVFCLVATLAAASSGCTPTLRAGVVTWTWGGNDSHAAAVPATRSAGLFGGGSADGGRQVIDLVVIVPPGYQQPDVVDARAGTLPPEETPDRLHPERIADSSISEANRSLWRWSPNNTLARGGAFTVTLRVNGIDGASTTTLASSLFGTDFGERVVIQLSAGDMPPAWPRAAVGG